MQTQTASVARRAPIMQKPQETANANAIHYGYSPFTSIQLSGPTGIELDVQPGDSPFRNLLPEKELIPFVTYEVNELAPELAAMLGDGADGDTNSPPVKKRLKSARECISEVLLQYQKLGFRYLTPLTGMDEAEASHIFLTIQPFEYLLKDMQYELSVGALERIAANDPYIPIHGSLEWNTPIDPLPSHLKPIAEKVRVIMTEAADSAWELADYIVVNSTQKIQQYFATGTGKRQADPKDRKFFGQMAIEIPSVFNKTPDRTTGESEAGYLKTIADALRGQAGTGGAEKDAQIAEMSARIDALTAIIEQRLVVPVTGVTEKCSYIIESTGLQCKMNATNGDRCGKHPWLI